MWGGCVHMSAVPVEASRGRQICWSRSYSCPPVTDVDFGN